MEEIIAFGMNPKKGRKRRNPRRIRRGTHVSVGGRKLRSNPKGGSRITGLFGRLIPKLDDISGVGIGLVIADEGVGRLREKWLAKTDPATKLATPAFNRLSMLDIGASYITTILSAYGVSRFVKREPMAIATYHGGLAVTLQKLLASGGTQADPKPIAERISPEYGMRLRAAFGGLGEKDEILFIPAGVGTVPEEGGDLEGLGQDSEEETGVY